MEVRATPGLNDGSMAFTLQTGTAAFVFTGDTLWVRGGAKRDYQRHNLRKLQESVRRQILTLPDETIVCPGHDNKGRSVSTVEEERLFNSRFSQPISEFEDYMTQEPPSAKSLAERPFLPPQSILGPRPDRFLVKRVTAYWKSQGKPMQLLAWPPSCKLFVCGDHSEVHLDALLALKRIGPHQILSLGSACLRLRPAHFGFITVTVLLRCSA